MDIKVVEIKEESVKDFQISYDSKKWVEMQAKTKENMAKNVEIKGFRKGQAPKELVEARLNDAAVMEKTLEVVTPEIMKEVLALADKEGVVTAQPIPSIIKRDAKELVLSLKFFKKPEIELADFSKFSFKDIDEKVEVTKEELEREIDGFMSRFAKPEDKDGKAEKGDLVVLDFTGYLNDKPFKGGEAKDHVLELGANQFIPGFEDQLVGVVAGDKKDVNVTFPGDYPSQDLAGKDVVFKCTVHKVQVKNLPAKDDAFAKTLGAEFIKTFADFENNIKGHIQQQKEIFVRRRKEEQITEYLVSESKVELPKAWIKAETDGMKQEFEQRLAMQGMDIDSYCEKTGHDQKFIEENLAKDAEKKLTAIFTLTKLKEENGVKVTEEEAKKEIEQAAKALNKTVDEVTEELKGIENFRSNLETKKAFDVILDKIKK